MLPPSEGQRRRMQDAYDAAMRVSDSQPTLAVPPELGLRSGQVIGKCEIVREIGRGGMGAVYLARHTTLDVLVAVKVLPPAVAQRSPEYAERFLREARMAAKLKHPNVLAVMDADRDAATGLYYMVTEYVDGGSIGDRVARGPLSEKASLQVIGGVAKALGVAAKQGIVHRDIKPANILVSKDGRVKLADLGLAKRVGADDLTRTSSAIGTPFYMSPEQARDSKSVDIRSDIYSLGATFYHMLTGRPPYPGDDVYNVLSQVLTAPTPDPRTQREDLSESCALICMRMMAKEVERRYQAPSEVLSDVAKAAVGQAPIELEPAPAVAAAEPVGAPSLEVASDVKSVDRRKARRGGDLGDSLWGPVAAFAAVAAVVIVGIVAVIWAIGSVREKQELARAESEKARLAQLELDRKNDEDRARLQAELDERKAKELENAARIVENPGGTADPGTGTRENPSGPPPGPNDGPAKPVAPPKRPVAEGALLALTFEDATISVRGNETVVADVSGKAGFGVVRGGPAGGEGRIGRGLVFDGVNDVIEFPAMVERTVAMWVRPNLPQQMGWFDGGGSESRLSAFQVGTFQPRGFKDGAVDGHGVFLGMRRLDVAMVCEEIRKDWHHVVVSWDGDRTVRALVDGREIEGYIVVAEAAWTSVPVPQPFRLPETPTPDATATTLVGRIRGAWWGVGREYFQGTMDEIAVWNRAMTLEEMSELWTMSSGGRSYCEEIRVQVEAAAALSAKSDPPPDPVDPKPPEPEPGSAKEPEPVEPKPAEAAGLARGCILAATWEHPALNQKEARCLDLSGSGNHLEMRPAVKLRPGRLGQGLMLDGSGDASSKTGAYCAGPALQPKSFATWFQCSEKMSMAIFCGGDLGAPGAAYLVGTYLPEDFRGWGMTDPGIYVGFWQTDCILPDRAIFDGGWHHIAISWDGDRRVKVALDGKIRGGALFAGGKCTSVKDAFDLPRAPRTAKGFPCALGARTEPLLDELLNGFKGVLDEAAAWDRPLSDEELGLLSGYAARKRSYCEEIERLAKGR